MLLSLRVSATSPKLLCNISVKRLDPSSNMLPVLFPNCHKSGNLSNLVRSKF